jgi:hypothetical protein
MPSPVKMLWLDNEADPAAWASREAVSALLDKARETGFNVIVPDVKNMYGFVFYDSQMASRPLAIKGMPYPQDFDLLRVVTEEARSRGLRVHAGINLFAEGGKGPSGRIGPVYDHPTWESVVYDRLTRIQIGDTISTFARTVNDRGTEGFSVLTAVYGSRVCATDSPACVSDGVIGRRAGRWVSADTTGPHVLWFFWAEPVRPDRLEVFFPRGFPMRALDATCDGTTVATLRRNSLTSVSLALYGVPATGARTLEIHILEPGADRIARIEEVRVIESGSGRNLAPDATVTATSTMSRARGLVALVQENRMTTSMPEEALPEAGWALAADSTVVVAEDSHTASLLAAVATDTPVTVTAEIVLLRESEHPGGSLVYVNPVHPEVQRRNLAIIGEVLSRYDMDGVILDRGRFDNIKTDFSDLSRRRFEHDMGLRVKHWPQDILIPPNPLTGEPMTTGPLFDRWVLWRAKIIREFFAQVRTVVRRHPGRLLGDYVGGWYPTYWEVGVNWAHEACDPRAEFLWLPDGYRATGYAQMLDYLSVGLYYPAVRKTPGVGVTETVEGGIELAQRLTAHRVKLVPGIYVPNLNSEEAFEDALRACIQRASGVMVFSHTSLDSLHRWEAARRGLEAVPIHLE